MPCWHIDEKNCRPTDANTQRPLWLARETSSQGIDLDKSHPWRELQQ